MNDENEFTFCGKPFGTNKPPLIVAEIGFNHNGDVELACKMIRSAVQNGADIVKLQTFIGGELVSKTVRTQDPDQPGREIFLYEFFQRYQLTRKDYETLFEYSRSLSMPIFSTPFDFESVDFLETLGVSLYKIASFDLVNLPLIKYVARIGKPIIISTGMSTLGQIEEAVGVVREEGNKKEDEKEKEEE